MRRIKPEKLVELKIAANQFHKYSLEILRMFFKIYVLQESTQRFALPALGWGTAKPSNQKNDKA
jgi:hypothetical protein